MEQQRIEICKGEDLKSPDQGFLKRRRENSGRKKTKFNNEGFGNWTRT
jgi:hypothetical protein